MVRWAPAQIFSGGTHAVDRSLLAHGARQLL